MQEEKTQNKKEFALQTRRARAVLRSNILPLREVRIPTECFYCIGKFWRIFLYNKKEIALGELVLFRGEYK